MAMDNIFTIDGVGYNIGVESIARKARLSDGPNADNALSGYHMEGPPRDFFDYTFQLSADGMSRDDYDSLYEVLTSPVDSHTVVAPYGQTTLSYEAYIEVVEDTVEYMDDGTCWGGLTVTFYAREPKKVPT